MPYLEDWSALEEDYLTSLSEAIQSLLNASFQLPICAIVRVRSIRPQYYHSVVLSCQKAGKIHIFWHEV